MKSITRIQLMKAICSSEDVGDMNLKQELEELYSKNMHNEFIQSYYDITPTMLNKIVNLFNEYTTKQQKIIERIY